ncbi:MAG: hypothetical protein KDD19_11005 [Phaeodactylibacter sp.]|nr:hypothetical protein [Phaeodactylibacter sp.]MCB9053882.1 hypothetical protein [Lewinellaceae bacterium]
MRFLQITLLLAVFSLSSHAQNYTSPLQRKVQFYQLSGKTMKTTPIFRWDGEVDAAMRNTVSKGHLIQLDRELLRQAYNADAPAITLQVPTGENSTLNLQLVQEDLFTDDFKVTSTGKEAEGIPYRPGRHYRGIVAGSSRSMAAVSIFEDKVMGVIETAEEGNMTLGAVEEDARGRYILYRTSDVPNPPVFECGTPGLEDATNSLRSLDEHLQAAPNRSVNNCVRVYLECDYDLFVNKGSVQNTADYMSGLFNVAATLYQNEGVSIVTSEIFIWQSPDDYATTSTVDALKDFRLNRPSFNGDLAHLVSRGAPAGGGVAWVDALCSSYNYGYSYIYSTYNELPAYSWSVNVITHEMGHNLGCWHTHDCSWDVNGDGTAAEAIDGCGEAAGIAGNGSCPTAPLPSNGGTIMSYCHLVSGIGINMNNGFGTLPGDKIRFEVGNAACLSPCSTCSQTVSISKTDANCAESATGSATASASGDSGPFTYKWSTGATTASISGLTAGTYSLSVTDASGCLVVESVTINQPPYIILSFGESPEAAPGANNGSINLTPSGGTPPYSYKWSTGATSQDLYGLSGGVYTVTVTDDNGCTKSSSTVLTSDGCTNMISTFPYTEGFESGNGMWSQSTNDSFNWTRWSGSTPTKRTGPTKANEGSYYLYIESSDYLSGFAFLQSPCLDFSNLLNPTVSFSYHMYGSNTGTLSVQASVDNGTNWTTIWMRFGDQGDIWQSATVSLSGYGSVYTKLRIVGTAGGQKGDMAIDAITVDGEPIPCNPPVLAVTSTPASCYGGADGTAKVTPTMGASPYTYAWPNGAPTQTAVGLSTGSYEVTVTDNNGCRATATATVGQPDEIVLSFDVTNVSVSGGNDGAIGLTVTGGAPGYTLNWSTGATSPSISGLSQGTYTVTVTDSNGCTKTGSATVTMPPSCGPIASLPYSESFESGFGLWNPGAGSDFNWSRNSGNTPSNNTGPSGASDGLFYAYTESTANNNSMAFLEGPCFDLSSIAMPSFSFDYHMNGNQMGTLRLEVSTNAGNSWQSIWFRTGGQGDSWQTAQISLNNYIGQTIRLRFSGTIGGVRSDMAIDNIGLFDAASRPSYPVASEVAGMQVHLHPNPANDWTIATIESPVTQDAELFLTGPLGRTRSLGKVSLAAGKTEISLPATELGQGLYFLSIQTKNNRLIERLLIQR